MRASEASSGACSRLVDERAQARDRDHLGDARAHLARADDSDGVHAQAAAPAVRPAASRSRSALPVCSHVKSGSSRPKWPYAAVFW